MEILSYTQFVMIFAICNATCATVRRCSVKKVLLKISQITYITYKKKTYKLLINAMVAERPNSESAS